MRFGFGVGYVVVWVLVVMGGWGGWVAGEEEGRGRGVIHEIKKEER